MQIKTYLSLYIRFCAQDQIYFDLLGADCQLAVVVTVEPGCAVEEVRAWHSQHEKLPIFKKQGKAGFR